jgi:hypothetical protein
MVLVRSIVQTTNIVSELASPWNPLTSYPFYVTFHQIGDVGEVVEV